MKNTIVLLFMFVTTYAFASEHEKQIIKFVDVELNHYPEEQLTDLYKSLFQDAFGPGHLIPDTESAGKYLDLELQQSDWSDSLLYQALGVNHDFYRINLILIKNGIIPRDTLLKAMIESSTMSRNPDIENWKAEWYEVLQIIKKTKPNLPELESDEKIISNKLSKGEVVMHHSEHYEKKYHPHYRIIHKSFFEDWFGRYIE